MFNVYYKYDGYCVHRVLGYTGMPILPRERPDLPILLP